MRTIETAAQKKLNIALLKHGYTRGPETPYMTEIKHKRVRRSYVAWFKQDHLGYHVVETYYAGSFLHKTYYNDFPVKHWDCYRPIDEHLTRIHHSRTLNCPDDMFLPLCMLKKKYPGEFSL